MLLSRACSVSRTGHADRRTSGEQSKLMWGSLTLKIAPNYIDLLQGRSQDFRKEGARLRAKRAKTFRPEATPIN